MPTRTGSASEVDASGGNGSASVSVPAAANCAVAFWAHWDLNGGSTLSGLTLNGVSFTIGAQVAEGASLDFPGTGVAHLVSPATGTQTLAWTWSAGGARSEGGKIIVVYVQDANISDPVRDTDATAAAGTDPVALTLTTESTDLLLAVAQCFATSDTPGLDGTVFINNSILNSEEYDASEVTPNTGTTTINMTGEAYSTMAAIALKATAGGGGGGPEAGTGGWGWPRWFGTTVDPVGGAQSGLYYIWRRRREGKPH